ncbi:hypothetical protein EVAR_54938_1 [Eumeta japonica]|uniref:Uncharacterized protein n=1 Tax=Eumeta variegata TaxID=151549 RepID=A0A4C1YDZ0_EUMVA|nr:hypothetical protein EVAR_54938_1 [Eumeta japonica]
MPDPTDSSDPQSLLELGQGSSASQFWRQYLSRFQHALLKKDWIFCQKVQLFLNMVRSVQAVQLILQLEPMYVWGNTGPVGSVHMETREDLYA